MGELLKGSLAHKMRLVHTALGVALAVGLVCGTFALSATIDAAFRRAVTASHAGAAVVVRAAPPFTPGEGVSERASVPESLLSTVQALPGVDAAWGSVSGYAQLAGDLPATASGSQTAVGRAWAPADTLVAGRAPSGGGEVAVAEATARAAKVHLGDRVRVLLAHGVNELSVVGIVADGGGPTQVAFDIDTAQRAFDRQGRLDEIGVRAAAGLSPETLRGRLAAALGDGFEVVTTSQAAEQAGRSSSGALRFLTPGLLVFSAVALLVSAFIIFNTFSILVAQRARELGLLRVLGAGRAQVMASVLVEAMAVGISASIAGVVLGLAAAHGLLALVQAAGFDLPEAAVVFPASTVVVGFLAGTLVTVAAAVLPAYRATRVAPIHAVRSIDGETGGPHSVRRRCAVGAVVTLAGAAEILVGLHANVRRPLVAVGLGAIGLLAGVAMLAPVVARPAARALGAPMSRIFGQAAVLGRENAMRNPRRTAATAAALMVGVGLIGVVSILTASMRASATSAVEQTVRADLVVTPDGTTGLPPLVADRLRQTSGVGMVSELRGGQFGLNGRAMSLLAVDPATVNAMYELDPATAASTARLDDHGVLVRDTVAARQGWRIGDEVPMTFARSGTTKLRLQATFSTTTVRTDYVISVGAFEANYADPLSLRVGVKLVSGTSAAAGRAAVKDALRDVPGVTVMDRSEVVADQRRQVNRLLVPMTALLGLSVVIGLLGIANTVALSVHERSGELGLLRAIGMDRGQLRSMISFEAAIVAALGTTLGLVLAVLFSWTVASALRSLGVTELVLPVGQLLRWAVVAVVAGMVASALPARRAAHRDILNSYLAR